MTPAQLNTQYGIADTLQFSANTHGLVVADIKNTQAQATIALQGAHLLHWQPAHTAQPVVWQSPLAQLLPGKSSHSGAPVCWPWFGADASGANLPAHGFARNALWEVIASGRETSGATTITLRLLPIPQTQTRWPHQATLELAIHVGETLALSLTTTNTGETPFALGEAFHTYLQVGDISQARITGLEGTHYADKVRDYAHDVQQSALTFSGETDRVYLDTEAACTLEDPILKRRIVIEKSGSKSTVVWTPWQQKAALIDDIGEQHWREMVCIESANALGNVVQLPPGTTHTLQARYRIEPL